MVWLTGWNYQKLLYINNSGSGATSQNYQLKITVNYGSGTDWTPANNIYCGGNCNSNFNDIRFTDCRPNHQCPSNISWKLIHNIITYRGTNIY